MKNFVKKFLLCTALTLSAVSNVTINADSCSTSDCKTECDRCGDCNKTFMATRSHGVNLALERSAGWQEMIHNKKKDAFGGNFQVGFFYQASTNGDDTARYFLPCKTKDCSTSCDTSCDTDCKTDCSDGACVTFGRNTGTTAVTDQDLNIRCFLHDSAYTGAAEERGKICMDHEQTAYGFYLNYYQDLEKIYKGLYMTINLPIVHVENDLRACFLGSEKDNLQKYFSGQVVNDDQEKLSCGLFGDKCSDDSTTSVADIDVTFGYHFYKTEKYYAGINIGFTIPTGTESSSKRLFSAVVGNHDHWALGFGFDGGAKVWECDNSSINLFTVFNYRYLFEDCECRMLGLKTDEDCKWGHYELLGDGKEANAKLIPAANLLCQNVDVTPGSQINWLLGGVYKYCGFSFDLGYELFWRDDESVCLKKCTVFEKNRYGIAAKTFTRGTTTIFGATPTDFKDNTTGTKYLSDSDINTSAAATPSLLTHKIYGGIAHTWNDWDIPFMVGAGAHYEFGSANENLETWGINIKAGVSF